jgi:integrase
LRDPKGTKIETIPLSDESLEILRTLEVASEYVFPGQGGAMRFRSSIRNTWKTMEEHAGISADFSFHGLRHNFASWFVSNGVDLATVQRLMTHKNASTTARYAHLLPGVMKAAAAKSGKLFGSVSESQRVVRISE